MNRSMINRIRMIRPHPDRTSWGRQGGPASDAGYRPGAAGHGSRMPSQSVSTRFQRPY